MSKLKIFIIFKLSYAYVQYAKICAKFKIHSLKTPGGVDYTNLLYSL